MSLVRLLLLQIQSETSITFVCQFGEGERLEFFYKYLASHMMARAFFCAGPAFGNKVCKQGVESSRGL